MTFKTTGTFSYVDVGDAFLGMQGRVIVTPTELRTRVGKMGRLQTIRQLCIMHCRRGKEYCISNPVRLPHPPRNAK